MKFTLSWLKDHLDTRLDANGVAEKLTMVGLEVEGVEDRAKGLEGFVVAKVLKAEKHPNADKLKLCTVDTGSGRMQVVCGAPNAREGLTGVFAASGAYIPGSGITLKKAEIRGVESNGMLLSEREMGLSDEHDGIVELDSSFKAGSSAVRAMGLDDPVIEVAITPNRGDCLGVRGIARDLAAAGAGKLKPLKAPKIKGAFKSPIGVTLDFPKGAENACPYFVGRLVRGVKNGESPKWLKDRLVAIGLRPISALVDITNFMTFAYGRPLHVFDADRVRGNLRVRLAKKGEKLLALDDKEYALDTDMCVIADDAEAEALGGVMGGARTGCSADTVNVFIESAYFDPVRTAQTGRRLQLMSDARYRFERGIDPAFLVDGIEIATKMVLDLCGGEASALVIAGKEPKWKRTVRLRADRVKTLCGVDVKAAEQKRILSTLGFEVKAAKGGFAVVPPSARADIVGEACLVEEIVRINGYHNIPAVPVASATDLPTPALGAEQARRFSARRVLAARGLMEAVTYSFLPMGDAVLFGGGAAELRLVNPISADLDVMRPSALPNLVRAAARNADRGFADAALFEVGPRFSGTAPEAQDVAACGVRTGEAEPKTWFAPARAVDAFDAKADVMALLAEMGIDVARVQVVADAPAWYHPGRSGSVRLGPKATLAHFGELHPMVTKTLGLKGAAAAFEVFFSALPPVRTKKSAQRPLLKLSPFQPVRRDFAFVVDAGVTSAAVVAAALGADKALVADVQVFDLFQGASLGEGKKSLALTATLQPQDRTLTDADIEAVAARIADAVAKATGGRLRG